MVSICLLFLFPTAPTDLNVLAAMSSIQMRQTRRQTRRPRVADPQVVAGQPTRLPSTAGICGGTLGGDGAVQLIGRGIEDWERLRGSHCSGETLGCGRCNGVSIQLQSSVCVIVKRREQEKKKRRVVRTVRMEAFRPFAQGPRSRLMILMDPCSCCQIDALGPSVVRHGAVGSANSLLKI